jgi:hydroxyethylthiazole kinase
VETGRILKKIKKTKPLIHHITNWVTIYDCANIVKALGASPVMAHAGEEAADMARMAQAVVLNIGTLTEEVVRSMILAGKAANKKKIPVVLDVCGAGATKFRDDKCAEILGSVKVGIIKGNASEVARIAGENVATKGVDAADVGKDLVKLAKALAKARGCAVVITGKEDIVTDGKKTLLVKNGHEMMSCVVGTGCMAASLIGTFAAVDKDPVEAAAAALAVFGVAGELAARISKGPASFKEKLFDIISVIEGKTMRNMQRVEKA